MLQIIKEFPRLDFSTFGKVDVVESFFDCRPLEFNFVDHLALDLFARLFLQVLKVQLVPIVVALEIFLELRVKA